MTQMSLDGHARPKVPRDRWTRPMVVPAQGGERVPYTRATTFVGAIEDTYTLDLWKQRMVATGLSLRPDLLLSVAAHRDDKSRLNTICADALDAAQGHAAATTGTALHSLTERMDRGMDVGVVPEAYLADLAAYATATRDMTAVHIEQFCVYDPFRVGGTPDRVVTYQGKRYIADLKTGQIDLGHLKIAAQLAMYARSMTYDEATDTRGSHGADLDRGIVIHLKAGTGTCDLYWTDLRVGWKAVQLCGEVRRMRQLKGLDTLTAFTDAPAAGHASVQGDLFAPPAPPMVQPVVQVEPTLEDLIARADSKAALTALWRMHAEEWNEHLTSLAAARVAALTAA